MTSIDQDNEELRNELFDMRLEHRDLDDAISRMSEGPFIDEIQLRRMKKRKLVLKDAIIRIEDQLIPDMDA